MNLRSDKGYRAADSLVAAMLGAFVGGCITLAGYFEDVGVPISTPVFFRGELALAGALLFGVAGLRYGKHFTDGVEDLIKTVRDYLHHDSH